TVTVLPDFLPVSLLVVPVIVALAHLQYLQGLHKNLQIQLPPTGHNAHVEDIVVSRTAIARIFLYLRLVFWQRWDIVDLFLNVYGKRK
nr:hypothetical protein [Tanacetum cinerariifolium]